LTEIFTFGSALNNFVSLPQAEVYPELPVTRNNIGQSLSTSAERTRQREIFKNRKVLESG